jgi:type II secretory pathway predicted ATPase ExeA
MYSKHFGFEQLPFSVTPDPRFFYSNAVYQDVLAGLEHGIEGRNGFIVVTGEAGTGKTILLHRLICSSVDTIEYALIINPRLSFIALLRTILMNLGLSSSSTDREALFEQLDGHLREQFTKGRTVALLFDEAQDLSDEVLEDLRLLCNQETDGATLTSIVLMGQPELEHRLDHSKLRQLKQRITLRRRLTPLQDPDVHLYLASRLKHVGYKGDQLFEPAGIERIISWSNGIPRLINTICDNALLLAYQASEHTVTAAMIDEVADQLRLVEPSPRANQKKTDEVANQPRFVDYFASVDRKQIDKIADQPRFLDSSTSMEEKIDELADQPGFVDSSPGPDQKTIDEITDQPQFVDNTPNADQQNIDEVANESSVDDRPPGSDQKTVPEIDQPQKLDITFSMESVEAGNTVDDTAKEDGDPLIPPIYQSNKVDWRNQRSNVNRLKITIGALMVLVVLAAGLTVFYPRQHEAAAPGGGHVETLSGANTAAAPAMPVDDVRNETMVEERSHLELASLSPSLAVPEDSDQNRDTPKKQNIVEVGKSATTTRPATQEIYRVSGPSFLRNRPTAEAEIIETLRPGTRVAVTSRSGEYYLVRSLGDKTVSGFVHKEDAFFERFK